MPGGPVTGPGSGQGPRSTTGGGIPIESDLGRWQFWWEFNKDPFLNLKEAIHTGSAVTGGDEVFLGQSRRSAGRDLLKPTEDQIVGTILPALKRALDATDDRDITSSCLVAMGKIGKDHETFKILDVMKARLSSNDQETRETAAISMGISQMQRAIPDLVALAKDSEDGRKLTGRTEVDNRTRAFACYGLGLIAYATSDVDSKRLCFAALRDVLTQSTSPMTDRNVPVAAINGIRLVRPNPTGGEKDQKLLADCIDSLWTYYLKQGGPGDEQVQAHVPPAIGQLLGRGGDTKGTYKDRFASELAGEFGKRQNQIYQSAAIALGILCQPQEVDKGDQKYSERLLDYWSSGKEQQTRSFCAMALAKIGGAANRNELLKLFAKANKGIDMPWTAVALGVLAYNAAEGTSDRARLDRAIGDALHRALVRVKNDETQSALAVALGLCKYRDAADDIRALLAKYDERDEFAGYLCIALALMDDRSSVDLIRKLVEESVRRPERLRQAAIALGKLGDKSATDLLQKMLQDDGRQTVATLSSIASALGFIGDQRSVEPLVKVLHDGTITPLSRAFAAAALGGVADKEPLPWNSKIAVDMNYRAAVETLTNDASGILDLL